MKFVVAELTRSEAAVSAVHPVCPRRFTACLHDLGLLLLDGCTLILQLCHFLLLSLFCSLQQFGLAPVESRLPSSRASDSIHNAVQMRRAVKGRAQSVYQAQYQAQSGMPVLASGTSSA